MARIIGHVAWQARTNLRTQKYTNVKPCQNVGFQCFRITMSNALHGLVLVLVICEVGFEM